MPLRLTFLVDSPSKRAHGNAVSRLALGLAESGEAQVTILCYSDDPAPTWLPPEVRIVRLGASRVSRALPGIARYLRSHDPDVLISRQVHANFVALAASLAARLRRRWHGKLVVVHDHPIALSHASNRLDNKWVAKVGYGYADGLICPSPTVRDDIIDWCRLDPSSVGVVPNPIPKFPGLNSTAPHPWLDDDGPPVFVNTSNMTPWKRLDLLIDAFAEVRRHHDARLIIVGEGPGQAGAVEKIRQLGLEDCAATVGWVEDPLQFAGRAWAFVLSSDEEGYAQVLTEAMSAGCPVISTDAQGGGPRFVTDDGQYGLLVPRNNARQLADAMLAILQPTLRKQFTDLGMQRAEALSPAASAASLLEFLDSRFGVCPESDRNWAG
jgi:glycosyltransferase involved in cell wall biosynthesis